MKRLKTYGLALTVAALLSVEPAMAHKVIASVFASGNSIEGEIGFSNGDMATDTLVEVFDEEGNKLGEATTDEDGFFSFVPTKSIVHVFRSNLGSGHVAEVRMELDELPDILNEDNATTPSENIKVAEAVAPSEPAVSGETSSTILEMTEAALQENRELMREMIHREVTPLRREIAAYKEKNDLQSILGGIGYIVGFFGLLFYIAARRKLAQG